MAAAASLVIDVGKKLSESAKNCEKGEARSELSSSLYSSLTPSYRQESYGDVLHFCRRERRLRIGEGLRETERGSGLRGGTSADSQPDIRNGDNRWNTLHLSHVRQV